MTSTSVPMARPGRACRRRCRRAKVFRYMVPAPRSVTAGATRQARGRCWRRARTGRRQHRVRLADGVVAAVVVDPAVVPARVDHVAGDGDRVERVAAGVVDPRRRDVDRGAGGRGAGGGDVEPGDRVADAEGHASRRSGSRCRRWRGTSRPARSQRCGRSRAGSEQLLLRIGAVKSASDDGAPSVVPVLMIASRGRDWPLTWSAVPETASWLPSGRQGHRLDLERQPAGGSLRVNANEGSSAPVIELSRARPVTAAPLANCRTRPPSRTGRRRKATVPSGLSARSRTCC